MSEYSVESIYNENVVEKINDMAKKRRRFNGKGIAVIIGLSFSIVSFFVVKYADSNILAYIVSSIGLLASLGSMYNDRYSLEKLFLGTTPSEDLKDRSKPNREIEFLNLLTNLDENEFSSLSNEAKNYFFVICSQQYNNYKLGGLDLLDNAFKFFIYRLALKNSYLFNENYFFKEILDMVFEIQLKYFLDETNQLKLEVGLLINQINYIEKPLAELRNIFETLSDLLLYNEILTQFNNCMGNLETVKEKIFDIRNKTNEIFLPQRQLLNMQQKILEVQELRQNLSNIQKENVNLQTLQEQLSSIQQIVSQMQQQQHVPSAQQAIEETEKFGEFEDLDH